MLEFKHLQEALTQYAEALREQYKDNLERDNRRATGKLISSINTKVIVNGNEFIIEFQLEEWWKYVEWDSRRHHLPRYAIDGTDSEKPSLLQWIRAKHLLPNPNKNGKLPTEQQLAWMIAKKIEKVGTKGTHDLEDTLYEVDYEHVLEEALSLDVWDSIDEIMVIFK